MDIENSLIIPDSIDQLKISETAAISFIVQDFIFKIPCHLRDKIVILVEKSLMDKYGFENICGYAVTSSDLLLKNNIIVTVENSDYIRWDTLNQRARQPIRFS